MTSRRAGYDVFQPDPDVLSRLWFRINAIDSIPTLEDLANKQDKKGYVTSLIAVDLEDIVGKSLEQFLDMIAVKAVGSELLMDISYQEIGFSPWGILIQVMGDVSEVLVNAGIVARNQAGG